MKTAIVLGATGLVGKALVEQLAQQQHIAKVIAVSRRPVVYNSDKVVNQVLDFARLADSSQVFCGDYLFSCLGTTLKQAGSVAAQRQVDLDYQLQVARMAADNGVGHYLLVSSSAANANSKSAYLKMKGQLESQVKSLAFTRISIFQPSLLLGQRVELRLAEKQGSYLLPQLCLLPGLTKYRPIRAQQVAEKMCQVSLQPGTGLEVFTLEQVFPK